MTEHNIEVLARRRLALLAQREEIDQALAEVDARLLAACPVGERIEVDGQPVFRVQQRRTFDVEVARQFVHAALIAPMMAWTDYRKDYQPRDTVTASKAFFAGWEASREYHRDTPEPELVFEPCACKEVTLARGQLEKVTDSRYRRTTHYRECCNVVSPIPKPEPVPQSYVESLESRIKVALALCEAWDDNAADAIEAALRGESA